MYTHTCVCSYINYVASYSYVAISIMYMPFQFMPENRQDASNMLDAIRTVYDSVFKLKH